MRYKVLDAPLKFPKEYPKEFESIVNSSSEINDSSFCMSLVNYRDNHLEKDFDILLNKISINNTGKNDIEKLQEELLLDKPISGDVAQILNWISGTCDIILALVPFSKKTKSLIDDSIALKRLDKTKKIVNMIQDDTEELFVSYLADLTPVTSAAYSIIGTVKNASNIDTEWKDYKNTLSQQINNLDNQIKMYENKLQFDKIRLEKINKIKKVINNYLDQNCQSISLIKS